MGTNGNVSAPRMAVAPAERRTRRVRPANPSLSIIGGDNKHSLIYQLSQLGHNPSQVAFVFKLKDASGDEYSLEVFVKGIESVDDEGTKWKLKGRTKNGNLTFRATYNTKTKIGKLTSSGPIREALVGPVPRAIGKVAVVAVGAALSAPATDSAPQAS